MKALTQGELNATGCNVPTCTTHSEHVGDLWLHGRCHPSSGSRVRYEKASGEIEVTCRKCNALIARVLVAVGVSA